MAGEGRGKRVTTTRAANTTAYTAEDAVGDTLEFTGLLTPASTFMIMSASLEYDVAALPASAAFRLELYNAAPTVVADNAAWSLVSADRAIHVGTITFDTLLDRVATLKVDMDKLNKMILAGDSRTLYGILVAHAGFTPAGNSEVLAVTLTGAPI